MANDKRSALAGLETSIKNSADLENNRYKNQAGMRNSHDDDAALFDDIGNSASAPGQRPRGIGANAAAGLFKGLAHGARTQSTSEKKGQYDKYAKQTEYLQNVQAQSQKMNEWHAQEEQRMETVKPFAVGGLEIAYSGMDYNTGNERMRNVIEQAKIADPRIKGDYMGYVPNSPIINLRTQDGEIIAYSLSNLVGEDVVKRVQGDYVEKLKLQSSQNKYDTSQDKLDVYKYDKGISGGRYGTPEPSQFGSIPIKSLGGRGLTPFMQTINAEINLAKDVPIIMHQLSEAERIIKANPSVGNAWNNYMVTGNSSKGLSMFGSDRTAYEELDKIVNRIAEAYIKAKGGAISESEREIIKKGLFSVTNNPESNKYNINSIRQELEIAKERGNFAAKELAKGFIATAGSYEEHKNSKAQNGNVNTAGQTNQAESPLAAFGKRIN